MDSVPVEVADKSLDGLPNDIVIKILKDFLDAKTLLRMSMTSKRFAALVANTVEAVILEVTALDFVRRFEGMVDGLFRRFPRLKHLHIVELIRSAPNEGCVRWQASFGSDFEIGYVLYTPPNENIDRSRSIMAELDFMLKIVEDGSFSTFKEDWGLATLASSIGGASKKYDILRRIVSKHTWLQSIAISDSFKSGMIFMGEEQIARSKLRRNGFDRPNIEAVLWDVPELDLPSSRCTLRDVKFFVVKPENSAPLEYPDVLHKCPWSNYDDAWAIFREARSEILFNVYVEKRGCLLEIPYFQLLGFP